jgi:hypothetical protein
LKNHIVHYMFRPSLVIIRCFKTLCGDVLVFCASDVRSVVPSHIRVFRLPACSSCCVVCLIYETQAQQSPQTDLEHLMMTNDGRNM